MSINVEQAVTTINQNLADLATVSNLTAHITNISEMMVAVRALGRAATGQKSARTAILDYLCENVGEVIKGSEFAAVSGVSDWARRVRELRTDGWRIIGGNYKPSEYERRLMRKYGIKPEAINARQYALLSVVRKRKPH